MDEPVLGHLRPARRLGLTLPGPVTTTQQPPASPPKAPPSPVRSPVTGDGHAGIVGNPQIPPGHALGTNGCRGSDMCHVR